MLRVVHPRSHGALRPVLAAAVVAGAAIAASASVAAALEPPPDVQVGSTPPGAESRLTVPIKKTPGDGTHVVMSLRRDTHRHDLPGVLPGDRLEPMAELEVTTDCRARQARSSRDGCAGVPYDYAPRVRAWLLLSPDRHETDPSARRSLPLGAPQKKRCTHRRHHCTFTFDGISQALNAQNDPCPSRSPCYVNLVVDAWNQHARPGNVLLIGENEPGLDPPVLGNHGRIAAVRVRPSGADPGTDLAPETLHATGFPVQPDTRTVVLSKEIGPVVHGTEFKLGFHMSVAPDGNYPTRVSSQVIIADGPEETRPLKVGTYRRGRVTPSNGINCLNEGPCGVRKAGVMRVTSDFSKPVYFNVLATAADPHHKGQPGDAVAVNGGELDVREYDPPPRG